MIMKVTENQIQHIYTFVQKRYVEWYDVQTELVDHLANGIENQWETNPTRSFDDALIIEFKKFGIFGFQDLVSEKIKALNKYYRKQVWLVFKAFFALPKIILTLFSIWILYSVIHVLNNKVYLFIGFIAIVFICHVFHIVKFKRRTKQAYKETGKKWLFETSIYQLGGLIHMLNIGIWFQPLCGNHRQWDSTSELIASICIVLYLLVFYISIMVIPEKISNKMSKEYPEYNFS